MKEPGGGGGGKRKGWLAGEEDQLVSEEDQLASKKHQLAGGKHWLAGGEHLAIARVSSRNFSHSKGDSLSRNSGNAGTLPENKHVWSC